MFQYLYFMAGSEKFPSFQKLFLCVFCVQQCMKLFACIPNWKMIDYFLCAVVERSFFNSECLLVFIIDDVFMSLKWKLLSEKVCVEKCLR